MKTTGMMKKIIVILLLFFYIQFFSYSQSISTFAGNGMHGFSGDGGPATDAELSAPFGIAIDHSGNLYIADNYNNIIRKVNTLGIISIFAGNGYDAGTGKGSYSGDGGPATASELNSPSNIAFSPSGNLYFSDGGNDIVRMINSSGTITTVAGNYSFGAGYSGDSGPATAAELYYPEGLAFDTSGNLYIADNGNNVIRRINTIGIISTVAGNHTFGGGYSGDGASAINAELDSPVGVTFDMYGNLSIADSYNNVIRQVNTLGIITTIAGNYAYGGGYSGNGGSATASELNAPIELVYDVSGNLYIADEINSVVRMVNSSGIISTVVGNHVQGYSGDGGPATIAELNFPYGLAINSSGSLYISDYLNDVIRKVSGLTSINEIKQPDGVSVYPNPTNGNITIQFNTPLQGNIEIYDITGQRIEQTQMSAENVVINLENQPNGVYFYRVLKEDGELAGSGKLVIEK